MIAFAGRKPALDLTLLNAIRLLNIASRRASWHLGCDHEDRNSSDLILYILFDPLNVIQERKAR